MIKAHAGITNADKIAIGIPPENPGRRRIHAPATAPAVSIVAATYRTHTLRYHDSIQCERRGKPFGATHLQLFVAIGEALERDPGAARLCGCFTTNPVTVPFTHADTGKVATYFGRWMSRRGEFGPWSIPTSMTIAA